MWRDGANLEISKRRKVITLSPDCKGIFQDLKALKVISPAVSEDILLAEAVFANNIKIRKGTKLSPFLVTGKQSEPPLVDDTGKLTHSSINRLKHLGVKAQEKENGDPHEVTNQHTSPSLVSCSAELVVKGNSQLVYNSFHSKPCKCGHQRPHNKSFPYNAKKDEYRISYAKQVYANPPSLQTRLGRGIITFTRKERGHIKKEEYP